MRYFTFCVSLFILRSCFPPYLCSHFSIFAGKLDFSRLFFVWGKSTSKGRFVCRRVHAFGAFLVASSEIYRVNYIISAKHMSFLAIPEVERARMRRMASIGLSIVALQRKYSLRKRTNFINVLLSQTNNIHQRVANSSSARPTVAKCKVLKCKVLKCEVQKARCCKARCC